MANDWQKVEASPTWNFKEQKEIIGTYLFKDEHVGSNDSNLYYLMQPDGVTIGVWGNKMLDDKFKKMTPGEDEIKIVYLGKVVSEKTGREYHSFEFYHRKIPLE